MKYHTAAQLSIPRLFTYQVDGLFDVALHTCLVPLTILVLWLARYSNYNKVLKLLRAKCPRILPN